MSANPLQFDPSIYQQSSTPSKCSNHSECISIKRLLTALSYYNHLDINNTNDQLIFNNFMESIYKYQIYDDFYHLTNHHQNEIQSIKNTAVEVYEISKCDLSVCSYSDRHFQVSSDINDESKIQSTEMKYFYVYQEVMDSLYFYVFHLIDSALRLPIDDEKMKEQSSSSNDGEFSRILSMIQKSAAKTSRFTRLKANVSQSGNHDKNDMSVDQNSNDTFLDIIYSDLKFTALGTKMMQTLQEIIESGDYDTESVYIDLEIYKESGISNISTEFNNEQVINQILTRFQQSKSSVCS